MLIQYYIWSRIFIKGKMFLPCVLKGKMLKCFYAIQIYFSLSYKNNLKAVMYNVFIFYWKVCCLYNSYKWKKLLNIQDSVFFSGLNMSFIRMHKFVCFDLLLSVINIFLNYQLSSNTISFIFWIFMIIYLDWPAIDTRPLGRTPICFFILSAKVSLSLLIIKILLNRLQSSRFPSLIVCASIN